MPQSNRAPGLTCLHAQFVADPANGDAFWTAVRTFVARCCFRIPISLKEDLIQNVCFEIMTSLPRFKPGTDFRKWVSAIIRNMRADSLRENLYKRRDTPFCQLGTRQAGAFNAELVLSTLTKSDESDLVSDDERTLDATRRLNRLRAGFKRQSNRELFDLLRAGKSLKEAAVRLGMTYAAVQRKVYRWRRKSP